MSDLVTQYALTPKQASYVAEFMHNGYNRSKAMAVVGCSMALATEPKVLQAIRAESKYAFDEARFSAVATISHLRDVATANVDDYFEIVGGRLMVKEGLTREQMAAISHIKTDKDGIIDIKLHDKFKAIDSLAKMLAWYQPEQIDHNIKVTDEEKPKRSEAEMRKALAYQLRLAMDKLKEKPKVTEAQIIED